MPEVEPRQHCRILDLQALVYAYPLVLTRVDELSKCQESYLHRVRPVCGRARHLLQQLVCQESYLRADMGQTSMRCNEDRSLVAAAPAQDAEDPDVNAILQKLIS